jgi:hypothetical protein
MPYSFVVDDEWGVPYAAKTFETIQDVHDEIRAMEELIDESSVSRAYALRACIDQLKQIVHEAEEEPETLPDRPAF